MQRPPRRGVNQVQGAAVQTEFECRRVVSVIRISTQGLAALSCGFDRNMCSHVAARSSARIDSYVNVQMMPFVSILFTGMVLWNQPQQAQSLTLLVPLFLAAARRSTWRFAHTRDWAGARARVGADG